jgi:hypothetical protein
LHVCLHDLPPTVVDVVSGPPVILFATSVAVFVIPFAASVAFSLTLLNVSPIAVSKLSTVDLAVAVAVANTEPVLELLL